MQKSINLKRWNNITGWVVFGISLIVYISTLEPTVSYWDCGEFLSCALNLEVSHPPGAPLFMLLGRIAACFNPHNPAIMVNGLSGLASAFTILFLFWTITWFGRKLYKQGWEPAPTQKIMILAAGVVGSLTYAFTDSFWFSAVEAEVYGLSSMLTALVFWCILKWEENCDSDLYNERWLVFIAYLIGISVGVHMLNLLIIPAIVFVYFFKRFPVNRLYFLKALGLSLMLLFIFLVVILKGIPGFLSLFELFTVNSLNLPINTGFVAGIALVMTLPVVLYIMLTRKKKFGIARWFLYTSFVLAGLSSYAVIVIRSYDNPPVDMTNPEDPFALANYLNREQYEQRPLFYGQSFDSPVTETQDRNSYQRFNGKYVSYPLNPTAIYDPNSLTLFPRMASTQTGHPEAYHFWVGDFHGKTIQTNNGNKTLPSLADNIRFFVEYQLGYMYFRYFMWNFAGKQNDIQGHGTAMYGNWSCGIKWIDQLHLGAQDKIPDWLKHNKGRNHYFLIPLLLGLMGLWYHLKKDKNNFFIALQIFVLTGIGLVVYLNEVPVTPRERDYVYVGSFYIFAIWVGIGLMALFDWLGKKNKKVFSAATAIAVGLLSPALLLQQNYDDHDRSGRYAALEYARNYLESCEPNAILFTNADNDTYPLWYAQEVEGIRRDIRLVLSPYLNADWYVDQMRCPIYDQEGLKMKLGSEKYLGGKRNFLPVYERIDSSVDMNSVLDFVAADDDRAKLSLQNGEKVNYIPVKKSFIPFTTKDTLTNPVTFHFKKNYLTMDDLVMLDIIASNHTKRPVYFTSEQVPLSLGIENYLKLDGYAFKLTPYEINTTNREEIGAINTKELYQKYMRDFDFKSLSNPDVYLDNTHVYTVNAVGIRNKFARLAEQLLAEGDTTKALEVTDKITNMISVNRVPYDYSETKLVALYFALKQPAKGKALFESVKKYCTENIEYMSTLKRNKKSINEYDLNVNMYLLQQLAQIAQANQLTAYLPEIKRAWDMAGGDK
jgi:hypothetical protein